MRTHPFFHDGRLVRVVESEGFCHIETSGAVYISRADITGPEILKLASEGARVWRALKEALWLASQALPAEERDEEAFAACKRVLDATAQTFDHNEPEEAEAVPAESTVWLCAKCGYGSQEHGLPGHPAFQCIADMRQAPAFQRARHDTNRPIPLVPEVPRAD